MRQETREDIDVSSLPSIVDAIGVASPQELAVELRGLDYLADEALSTSLYLALALRRPLLLEGEPGVGKTEVAKCLARLMGSPLIRLQCYEGIDVAQSLYEWNYARQLIHLRSIEATSGSNEAIEDDLYDEKYLIRRPLLRALDPIGAGDVLPQIDGVTLPPVLLIDELDRADDEFEAFLLEALSDFSVTIPELGTIHAEVPPIVVVTSNRTRDLHDALKRRCLYHWVEHPGFDVEVEILRTKVPGVGDLMAKQVAALTGALRAMGLFKPPGIAESIDWLRSLVTLGATEVTSSLFEASLSAVIKYREDQMKVKDADIASLVRAAVVKSQ